MSSCDVQRDMCADSVQERGGLVVQERFDDPDGSSETLEREALQRLMREIEAGHIDCVAVTHIDRLTRRLVDLAHLLEFFEQHNIQLSVLTDPQFGETAANRLMSNIVAAASQFQQELTRERMAETRSALKNKGRRVAGRVPYGYVADKKTRQLVVQLSEAAHVRQMFRMAAAGKRPKEIADFANDEGWRTRGKGSGLWTARQVLKLLSNPTYVGQIRNGDGTLPGQHNRIVTQNLFDQVQAAIAARRSRKPSRSTPNISWPLRGLLKCGRCSRKMSPSISGYRVFRYLYYRCRSTAGGRPPCVGVCLPAGEIERFVLARINEENWEELSPEQEQELKRFYEIWQNLDERTQTKHLAEVVQEVVFAPDEKTLAVTLVDRPAEKILAAHRNEESDERAR